MPVTRINNNQISDSSAGNLYLGIDASTKLQDYSITSGKIANNLTYGSDLTVAGNLTVTGNTTTIDTVNVVVEDPLILLADAQTGSPTLDIGYIGKRGTEENIALVWDESAGQFVAAFTDSEVTNTTINITSYASFYAGNLETGGTLDVTGVTTLTGNVTVNNFFVDGQKTIDMGNSIIGNVQNPIANSDVATKAYVDSQSASGFTIEDDTANTTVVSGGDTLQLLGTSNEVTVAITAADQITFGLPTDVVVAGNLDANNLIATNNVDAVTVTATGNVNGNNVVSTNDVTTATVTASGNIDGANINASASVVATGNISGNNAIITNLVQGTTLTATGNVNGNNVVATNNVDALTVTATGNLNGNNAVVTNDVSTATLTASGNVLAQNVNSNAAVTGVTGSFSGNVDANNAIVTNLVQGTTVTATGNLNGNNAVVTNNVDALTITATGNLNGNNAVITNNVGAATVTATGNIDGGNLNATTNVTGTTLTASANINANNAVITNDVSAATGTFSGNIDGANLNLSLTAFVGNVEATGNLDAGIALNTNSIHGAPLALYSSGDLSIVASGNILGNGSVINNIADPVQPQDAATKYYVDTVAEGLHIHASCEAATPANLATISGGTITYNNGSSGDGATLTTTGTYSTIDGVNIATVGTRILVKDESTQAYNGIYTYANATALVRATDYNSAAEIQAGDLVFVNSGNIYGNSQWVQVDTVTTVGTDPIVWEQFGGAGTYSAGNGIVIVGTVITAKVDEVSTSFDAGGNIVVKPGATLVDPFIGNATANSLAVAGNGLITATTVDLTGNLLAQNVNSNAAVTGVTGIFSGNVDANNAIVTNNIQGGTVTSLGNIDGANVNATTNVTALTVTASGNLNGNNAVITNDVSTTTLTASGNVLADNVNSNAAVTGVTITASGNLNGNNAIVTNNIQGGTITSLGNIDGANVNATTNVTGITATFTGNVNANNIVSTNDVTTATVTATGNIDGANLNATTGVTGTTITATGNLVGNNATITNDVAAATVTLTGNIDAAGGVYSGNVTAQYFIGDVIGNIAGNIDAGGANTQIQFNDEDVLNGSAAFTFDKTSNLVTASGNISAGNLIATTNVEGVTLTASGNVNANNAVVTNGVSGATGTFTTSVQGGNITISGDSIDGSNGIIIINDADADTDFAVNGDTTPNVFYVDAGTGTASFGNSTQTTGAVVAFNSTDTVLLPVGNTTQRPSGVTGMFRYNTTEGSVEWYDGSDWQQATSDFTVIVDDSFQGDGSTTTFTLSQNSTTAGTIVTINGVVQIPTTAYSVTGNSLQFTEAPEVSDTIDARILTTTATVSGIEGAGGASFAAGSGLEFLVTGDLIPTANITYDLGNSTNWWKDGYFAGNTLFLGGLQLKSSGNTFAVYTADGVTQANIDAGAIDVSAISSGTSSIGISGINGNAYVTVGGTANVLVVGTTGANVTGTLGVSGNITGSYILGNGSQLTGIDATSIQNGTANVRTILNGNVTVSAAGQANVVVVTSTGANIAGTLNATGNANVSNLGATTVVATNLTGTLTTAAQPNVTSLGTLSSLSISGNLVAGNLSVNTGTVTLGGIINSNANGVGNIGSSTTYFNTVFAKATSAQYADLAEMYEADNLIEPGTVVCFGGAKEVTVCGEEGSRRVAGVVSTNPSYIMNAGLSGDNVVAVALTGRVPTKVTGTIRKGDMLVAAGDGRARAEANPAVGQVIGKALADFDGTDGVIEVVVGRL